MGWYANVCNVIKNLFHNIQTARGDKSGDKIKNYISRYFEIYIKYFFASFTQGFLLYLKIILINFRDTLDTLDWFSAKVGGVPRLEATTESPPL